MVKSVDAKRPSVATRVESARPASVQPAAVRAAAPEVDSGFHAAKKKPVNMTGRYKPVAMEGDEALKSALSAQLRVAQAGGAGAATKASGPKVTKAVTDFLKEACRETSGDLKQAYLDIKKAVEAGDYGKASKLATALLSGKADDQSEAIDAALGLPGTKSTEAVIAQLDFLAKMQAAGVKADYPPSEQQLVDYFGTLKGDPQAARDAFEAYTGAFHAHPANAGRPTEDVEYSGGDSSVPESWSEVTGRDITDRPEHLGKQMNDCEGFAFMAERLMTAAGFKVQHHLTTKGGPTGEHGMVSFKHPKEKVFTVTSNDQTFTASSERQAAIEGFNYASPQKAPAKMPFYTGATMLESQQHWGADDKKNRI